MRNLYKIYLVTLFIVAGFSSIAQWTTQNTAFATANRGIRAVSVPNATDAWAVAYDGSGAAAACQDFTRTSNGGTTWTSGIITGQTGWDFGGLTSIDASTAWVIMYNGTAGGGKILKTTNGGTSWTHQTTATFTASLGGFGNVVHFWNANEGFAMGDPTSGYYEIYTTLDGGTNWTRTPSANIPAPVPANEYGIVNTYDVVGNHIWFGTTQGRVYHSNNRGLNWTVAPTGAGLNVYIESVSFKDTLNGMAVAINSGGGFLGLYRTNDGGATWNPFPNNTGLLAIRGVEYIPGTNGSWVVYSSNNGAAGSSYSNDDGNTWVNIDNIQHLHTSFLNSSLGYSGGFNTSSTIGGMFKYSGNGVPTIQKDTTVCGGFSVTLTANGSGTINWYDSHAGGLLLATGNTFTTPILNSSVNYYVESAGTGTIFRNQILVDVISPTSLPNAPDVTICSGNTANLNASGNGVFNWYNSASGGSAISTGSSFTTPILNQTDTFYVDQTFNGCSSQRKAVIVTVTPTPAAPVSNDVAICSGQSAQLSASSTAGNITWYNSPTGTTSIGQGGVYNTIILTQTDTFYAGTSLSGCFSARTPVIVTVNPLPNALTISGATNVLQGNTENYSFTLSSGSVYEWTITGGTPATATGNNNDITWTGIGTGTITVIETNSNGCETSTTKAITIMGVGIEEIENQIIGNPFPNPANNLITIPYYGNSNQLRIELISITGQIIQNETIESKKGQIQLSLENVNKGLYFLMIFDNDKKLSKKITVIR